MSKHKWLKRQQQQPQPRPPASPEGSSYLVAQAAFSGPLPPPSMLAEYDKIVPGGAGRLVTMAETQMAHRHRLEKEVTAPSCPPELLQIQKDEREEHGGR